MAAWIERARSAIRLQLEPGERAHFDEEFWPEGVLRAFARGASNVIVVAPHGFPGDDDHTDYLSYFLSRALDASYLINNKAFCKPGNGHALGVAADLNRPWSCDPHTRAFTERLVSMAAELGCRLAEPPLVLSIHGMSDANAQRLEAGDFCIGAGYTRADREAALRRGGRASASRATVDGLLAGLERLGFRATDGVPQYSARRTIPAFLREQMGRTGPLEAVQIEIRYRGLRDPAHLVQTARSLARVVEDLPGFRRPPCGRPGHPAP
jgi:hypothetical protein